jgi:hypothetical protein
MSELGTYHWASTMMRKTLDWNRSRISILEVQNNAVYNVNERTLVKYNGLTVSYIYNYTIHNYNEIAKIIIYNN